MKNNAKLLFGVVIVIIIAAGIYFASGSDGFSITGAFIGGGECVGSDAKDFYEACSEWRSGGYSTMPSALSALTATSARQMCDKLLREYRLC